MARKNKTKLHVLRQLRDENPSYCERVSTAIASIPDDFLSSKDTQRTCAQRISRLREQHNLSLEEVGEILGVSHPMVRYLETLPDEKGYRPISKYYLEALSHIYYVSPHYIVGNTCNPADYTASYLTDPLIDDSPKILNCARYLLKALYPESGDWDKTNQKLLCAFVRICSAKYAHRILIRNCLKATPTIENLYDDSIEYDGSQVHQHTFDDLYTVSFCTDIFYTLGVRDFALLDLMARIATAPLNIKELVYLYLDRGGFLTKPKGFVRIDDSQNVTNVDGGVRSTKNLLNIGGSIVPVPDSAYFFQPLTAEESENTE